MPFVTSSGQGKKLRTDAPEVVGGCLRAAPYPDRSDTGRQASRTLGRRVESGWTAVKRNHEWTGLRVSRYGDQDGQGGTADGSRPMTGL